MPAALPHASLPCPILQGNGVARCKQQYQDEDLFIVDIYNAKAYPWDKDAKPVGDVAACCGTPQAGRNLQRERWR